MSLELDIAGETLSLRLSPKDKVLALKGAFDIPLEHIADVRVEPRKAMEEERGIRAPGTGFPGKIALGTWRGRGGKQFWYVRRAERVVVIELEREEYRRLVLEVPDPDAEGDRIRKAAGA